MKEYRNRMLSAALAVGLIVATAGNAAAAPIPETDSVAHLPLTRSVSADERTGSTRSISGAAIGKYPSADIRNQLTGLIPGLEVQEKSGTTGITAGSDNAAVLLKARGKAVQYIVDDVPVYITQLQLDPEEIESVTLLTDIADKAQFGPMAADGVLYIRTKRGRMGATEVKLSFERGVSIADRFPEWVNGVDYAKMNNFARYSEGLQPLYGAQALDGYRKGNPDDLQYPNVDFRSLMLKDTKPYTRAGVQIDGGTKAVRYNAHVGYTGEGDIYKIGPTSDYNRLNVRTRVEATITKRLTAAVDFFGGMTFRRSPLYGRGTTNTDELTAVLSDLQTIPSIAFPLHVTPETVDAEAEGRTMYGVSNSYQNNPVAALLENGSYTTKGRTGMVNAMLDYDCSSFAKGLKSTTFVNLNVYSMTRIGKNPDYVAYIYNPTEHSLGAMSATHRGAKVSDKSLKDKYTYQSLNLYERLSYDFARNGHKLGVAATYYISSVASSGKSSYDRQQNLIGTVSYDYDGRYLVEGVVDYAGTSRLRAGNRYEVFPSVGLGWVVSKEAFMQNASWLDLLKVRAQAGVLGYENFGTQYLYEDDYQVGSNVTFGPSTVQGSWLGTSSTVTYPRTNLSRLGNPNLGWEKRKEASVGVDMRMLRDRLDFSATWFYSKSDGIITQMSSILPLYMGQQNIASYQNYNASQRQGIEASLSFGDRVGDFGYRIGGSLTWTKAEYLRYNETYTYDYQAVAGTATDAYRGYVCLGKFASEAEIASSPVQLFDEKVQVGDLKYADLNGDGRVDSNDQCVIGHTDPRLVYAIDLHFDYKWFDLTIVGTGRAGYQVPFTNAYFWNGWGDNNYSKFVKENYGGDYPRITYNKVNNNFQKSAYWLRDGGFFKIQNVELGFNAPLRAGNRSGIRKLRLFVRAANLLTISKIKEVDPESVDSGVTTYPLFRTVTGGINLTF